MKLVFCNIKSHSFNSQHLFLGERMERDTYGDVLYISHLAIENVHFENEGKYGCAVENNSMNVVNLVINGKYNYIIFNCFDYFDYSFGLLL